MKNSLKKLCYLYICFNFAPALKKMYVLKKVYAKVAQG